MENPLRGKFPIRRDTVVPHRDRKLFAKGFLSGLAPWLSLPTGNYSRKVSYPAWHYGCPYRQETVCERFPIRHGTMVILTDRKLFAKGFLSDLALWLFLPTGNYSRKVSYPAWHHGYPYRQETVCERFPIRRDTMAVLTDRKLFAKGFLSGMTLWLSLLTGNYSRKVSYPAWHHGCPYRQETICERFPIRLGTMAVLTDRKLFAKGFLSGLALWLSLPTGNYLRKGFRESVAE